MMTDVKQDCHFMSLALDEAKKHKLNVFPNPFVGCVITWSSDTSNTKLHVVGCHVKAGNHHAEVAALIALHDLFLDGNGTELAADDKYVFSGDIESLTLYCTLEPCDHEETICYGNETLCTGYNTGTCTTNVEQCKCKKRELSCCDMILKYPQIKRVVVGVLDPDHRVSGKGIEKLRRAGIQVDCMKDLDEKMYKHICYEMRSYIHHRTHQRPWVTAKIALTQDDCYTLAVSTKEQSRWITHPKTREELYNIWRENQALILTQKTITLDGCLLDDTDYPSANNATYRNTFKRYAISRSFSTLEQQQQSTQEHFTKLRFFTPQQHPEFMNVLVEGGGIYHKYLFDHHFVDEVVICRGALQQGETKWPVDYKALCTLMEKRPIILDTQTNEVNYIERYIVNKNYIAPYKKAILFDLDGTLVNTAKIWTTCDKVLLDEFGHVLSEKVSISLRGLGFKKVCEILKQTYHLPISIEEMQHKYNEILQHVLENSAEHLTLMDDSVLPFIKTCKEKGYQIAIASNGSRDFLHRICKIMQLDTYFGRHIYSSEDVQGGHAKPAPDLFIHAARCLGVEDATACVVFEDSACGVDAAIAANMQCIAVFNPVPQAHSVIYSFREISF